MRTDIGDELAVRKVLESLPTLGWDDECSIPVREETRRDERGSHIDFKMLLPGCVFIKSYEPERIRKTQEMMNDLGRKAKLCRDRDWVKIEPVSIEDVRFLDSILEDNLMYVSLLDMTEENEIKSIVGPLSYCWDKITEFDFDSRKAVADIELFGEVRRIHFGIWGYDDPKIVWLEKKLKAKEICFLPEGCVL